MRNSPRAERLLRIAGPVFRRIEGYENIRKESFHSWLPGFTHHGVSQFIARGHDPFTKPAQFRASLADGQLGPFALRVSCAENDVLQLRRRGCLEMRVHFPR